MQAASPHTPAAGTSSSLHVLSQLPDELWALVLSKCDWKGAWQQTKLLLCWRPGAARALQAQPQLLAHLIVSKHLMQVPDRCTALDMALHWTVLHARPDVLAVLLADKDIAGVDVVEAMRMGAVKGAQPVVELLLRHTRGIITGVEWTKAVGMALHSAAMYGHVQVMQHILAFQLPEHDDDMEGPVFAAAIKGHHAAIHMLFDHGADVTAQHDAVWGAAKNGHLKALEVLLDAGAPMEGVSLLDVARGGHDDVLRLLIERGLQRTTRQKEEAMRAAAVAGYSSTAELLLGWGVHTRAAARRMAALLQEAQRHQQGLQQ